MTNKLAPPQKILNRCKVHKYRRFAKTNKTYRTDIYYCVNCPSYVMISNILGHRSICWRCNNIFIIGADAGIPLKPTCDCKERIKLVEMDRNSLEWLDSSIEKLEESNQSRELVPTKESVVADLLSIIEGR